MFPLYRLILMGSLFFGPILLILGTFLLLKMRNKIPGILVMVAVLASALFPLALLLYVVTTVRTGG